MTAEFGVFFLIIGLLLALLQAGFLYPAERSRTLIAACLVPASLLQLLCIALAFATLIILRMDSDFSVKLVVQHSNLSLPMLYKIVGSWGNHEGSMLLWVLVLAGYGTALALSGIPDGLRNRALAVQAIVGAGALLFILLTSNPFLRQFPPPVDGQALNPILQDIALAMHPPLLYLGYVGFSVVFSLAVAALLQGHAGRDWAQIAHSWILAAWSALTLGIGLGSWWAYRELGWGGWWFWDPVENASLLPWLAATALLHSNIVLKKREALDGWVMVLAIITFALSLLGTFLVRSGALTSVHSFASDPTRGLFILAYMVVIIGGALLLFALRAGKLTAQNELVPASREGLIVLNNLFLLTACATVLLGTVYPLIMDALSDDKVTVGAPYFNAAFLPLMSIALMLAGIAPLMPWKSGSLRRVAKEAKPALLAALAMGVIVLAAARSDIALAIWGSAMAAWLAVSSLQWLVRGRAFEVFLGHMAVAVLVAGITGVSLGKREITQPAAPGQTITLNGYHLLWNGVTSVRGPNYEAERGEFILSDSAGRTLAVLHPEHRLYDIAGTATSETAIYSGWGSDIYTVIGESLPQTRTTEARVYVVPMIRFIWLGFVLMASSGIIALRQSLKRRI